MKAPQSPSLDPRREHNFEAELTARARAWVPAWGFEDGGHDFGHALLQVASQFNAKVAEGLDRGGDKMQRGFLDWLAVRGDAARPARMPVVFKMVDKAPAAVLALAPVRMQVDAQDATVVFETEDDVRVIPGRLEVVVATDADQDAIFLQMPGLTSIEPLKPLPTQWRLKSFAAAGSTQLQLDPEVGLVAGLVVELAGLQYRIDKVDKDIVTIDPALPTGAGVEAGSVAHMVMAFEPFNPSARNRQQHAVYLGHLDLLNIEAAATIDVIGAQALGAGATWAYWGKVAGQDSVAWQALALAKTQPSDGVRLDKPRGAVEPRDLGAVKKARWIGAFTPNVLGNAPTLSVDALELRINFRPEPACPIVNADDSTTLAAQALANTTPLVLSGVFYPLGRTPRQFDTFYLGCPEAFSKPGAHVQLCFELADPTSYALSTVHHGAFAEAVLAGVGQDRALHLFEFKPAQATVSPLFAREPLQPPSPVYNASPLSVLPIPLDAKPTYRLPMWAEGQDFVVATVAGSHVWLWREVAADSKKSGWRDLGVLPTGVAKPPPVDGLVYLGGNPSPRLVALQDGRLSLRAMTDAATWVEVIPKDGADKHVVLKAIAAILVIDGTGRLVTSAAEDLVGVDADGKLYRVTTAGICTYLNVPALSTRVTPIALKHNGGLTVVAAEKSLTMLVALKPTGGVSSQRIDAVATILGFSLEATLDGIDLACLASARDESAAYLVTWVPAATGARAEIFKSEVPASAGRIGGAPTRIATQVLIPGENGDAVVAPFDLGRRLKLNADVETGIVVPAGAPALAVNDVITLRIANNLRVKKIDGAGVTRATETFHPIAGTFGAGPVTRELLAYRMSTGATGNVLGLKKFELAPGEHGVAADSTLLIQIGAVAHEYVVDSVAVASSAWIVTLASALPAGATGNASYWLPVQTGGRIAPFARLNPAHLNEKCDVTLLEHGALVFPGAKPERQTAQAFATVTNFATLVVMGENFAAAPVPGANAKFLLDSAVGDWSHQLGDGVSNPELSWEYWNGAWSKLIIEPDETLNLKSTGALRFVVPPDIGPTDWAGKTSFWVRARLVGGDYGSEEVTVLIEDLGNRKTKQTIQRSSKGIRPPSVVNLGISYSMRDGVMPAYVLAEDSGSIRDQSDANRTEGAIVEGFIPLAVTLGRLRAGDAATPTAPVEPCPPECDCADGLVATAATAATGASTPASASAAVTVATGRALFLGFDADLSGASVNVLFVSAREHDHAALAPLRVDALVGNRFVPLVSRDGTRALGETGLLTLAFSQPPTRAELFGRTLVWLRLAPTTKAAGDGAAWQPSLTGAYLNAAWVSATETLTRELLGSSEGAPDLTLKLARPPVLRDSLELRVRDLLGDEERQALQAADPDLVLNDADLPGDWVRWKQVADPADAGPAERVFAFDETTGVLRFGDGLHGAIPPVGRDSIVAFRYQRTEPPVKGAVDVPANTIEARAQLNLVTPVGGVEAVFSADHAAGGAPPEPDDRVLRFGSAKLRHRGRAVTARDLEDLALASSPDIVQARALVQPRHTRLVVVMRGPTPAPTLAQRRELGRLLLGVAPFTFGAASGFAIDGPRIRQLRIRLALRVEGLDHAGRVAQQVAARLETFFDSATGGLAGDGWPLGANPREDDIALSLLDLAHLHSIAAVSLVEAVDDTTERPWPGTLKPDQIVRLADDAIRFEFQSMEVAA